eukprot:CAMPEP_0115006758 /NCGR_PEP_ID=MMETSP0216-20121206/20704_1 /TAXON_ID=223996 /ORGANISM="Protocruzia adherens, Strain Boccale" /LENGTH=132 /DNA_ID=CAMNT_0002373429 /DNA_START=31 /DNA_END=429 /DNA_ORIENTATION=-
MAWGIVPALQSLVVNIAPWPLPIKAFLLHPAGPFTIHFVAPTFKWGITFANISDLKIPAENISTPQQSAILLTGCIWARYATQIKPFNWNLMLCNIFMAGTAAYQLSRKWTEPKVSVTHFEKKSTDDNNKKD